MSKTKVEHIIQAYKRLRISGITAKATPEDIFDALEVFEDMMHNLKSRNICSTYIFEDEPSPNSNSGIDPQFNEATSTNLATRMAVFFGKNVPESLNKLANAGMSNWSARTGIVNQIAPPNRQPRGSGNTFRFPRWLRYYRVESGTPISCDTFDLKVGETDIYQVSFANYLLDGATIVSATLEASNGINILTESFDDDTVTMECEGIQAGSETVKVTVVTSTPRTTPEVVFFNVIGV